MSALPPLPMITATFETTHPELCGDLRAYATTYGERIAAHFERANEILELETDYLRAKVTWLKALLEDERAKAREVGAA